MTFTAKEISQRADWGFSESTTLRIFRNEPGVLKYGSENSRRRHKVSIRIPEDVYERVRERLTNV